jgi:uncharacterized protein YjbJ (UPF0337 family)
MNRDTAEGKFDQAKGKTKQSVGEVVGNERLANSGTADQIKGAAKEAWGNTKDAADAASRDTRMRSESTAHDVREKMTSTAQNAKDKVNAHADDVKMEHKRSA